MKDIKIYISAGIFVILTAIRLLSPKTAAVIADTISDALCLEYEQTQELVELGASLTEEGLIEAVKLMYIEPEPDTDDIPVLFNIKLPTPEKTPEPTPSPTKAPVPDETEKPVSTPEPTAAPEPTVPPEVEEFLSSQAAFTDKALPADVSSELLVLPFSYTEPIKDGTASDFGYRLHPILNDVRFHYGTDIGADYGEAVYAFADGEIYAIGEDDDGLGLYIMIDHADGFRTLYAHCSELLRTTGAVKRGEKIAEVGSSGLATGPHLHFELSREGIFLDPEYYI